MSNTSFDNTQIVVNLKDIRHLLEIAHLARHLRMQLYWALDIKRLVEDVLGKTLPEPEQIENIVCAGDGYMMPKKDVNKEQVLSNFISHLNHIAEKYNFNLLQKDTDELVKVTGGRVYGDDVLRWISDRTAVR